MIRDTQQQAWDSIQGKLGAHQRAVLAMIRERRQITMQGLSDALHWTINCVSGRVTELAKEGLIRDSGVRTINPATGRRCTVWEIAAAPEQLHLFSRRAA